MLLFSSEQLCILVLGTEEISCPVRPPVGAWAATPKASDLDGGSGTMSSNSVFGVLLIATLLVRVLWGSRKMRGKEIGMGRK